MERLVGANDGLSALDGIGGKYGTGDGTPAKAVADYISAGAPSIYRSIYLLTDIIIYG